jgi:hypothetical protein
MFAMRLQICDGPLLVNRDLDPLHHSIRLLTSFSFPFLAPLTGNATYAARAYKPRKCCRHSEGESTSSVPCDSHSVHWVTGHSPHAAPDNELEPVLKFYYHLGMNDKDIATAVMDHFDASTYNIRYVYSLYYLPLNLSHSISLYTVRCRQKVWGLSSTQEQHHTIESIATHISAIKEHFPNHGAETIRKALLMEKNIRVPRSVYQVCVHKYTQCIQRPVISDYLRMTEPDAVQAQRYQHFKRRTFLSIGPNKMWSLDQHDKFKQYGLFFHVGLDPYPGIIHWCKVWWTVRNPKLIARFYLDAACAVGGMYYSKTTRTQTMLTHSPLRDST